MDTKLLKFKKTSHFLLRQWQRNIDDSLLLKAFIQLTEKPKGKTWIIVSPETIRKWAEEKSIYSAYKTCANPLFIRSKGEILITCFFAPVSHFIGRKDQGQYILIQK